METPTNDPAPRIHEKVAALLHEAVRREASDVHLVPGFPVTYRIHGELNTVGDDVLSPEASEAIARSFISPHMAENLGEEKSIDCSLEIEHEDKPHRFRANVYMAQQKWCACLRHVPDAIPSFEWMNFPQGLAERLISHTNGLVIVTGVTGSGKSTTLAAMINMLNERGGYRVITIEEPIEYDHKRVSSSMVTQREVGRDVDSFYDGLKYGLRQDPDVILVGEIRDIETARMALSAAETGHLILATLHTKDAKGAITRFVDLFPHDAQDDVRTQLALSLRSVVNQHLLPCATPGEKRVLALEVLHITQPARFAIKFGKVESIDSILQTGGRDGMVTLDDDLQRLLMAERISLETARRFAKDPEHLVTGG